MSLQFKQVNNQSTRRYFLYLKTGKIAKSVFVKHKWLSLVALYLAYRYIKKAGIKFQDLQKLGAKLIQIHKRINAIVVEFAYNLTPAEIDWIKDKFNVDIEPVREVTACLNKAVNQTKVATAWKSFGYSGIGVTVAVLDTGINDNHVDLSQSLKSRIDFTGENLTIRNTWWNKVLSMLNLSTKKQQVMLDPIGHGCVTSDSLVYTSLCGLQTIETMYNNSPGVEYKLDDGANIKDISRFNINTISMNKKGASIPSTIQVVHKIPYNGTLYHIKTKNGIISLTPWHKVFVVTSKRGKSLTIKEKRADELKVGEMLKVAGPSKNINKYHSVPLQKNNWVKLDENLAYLGGLIITDGHLVAYKTSKRSNYRIEFTNNSKDIINEYCKLFYDLFKYKVKICKDKRQPGTYRAFVYSKELVYMFNNLGIPIGKKSLTIKLPSLITKSPRSVIFSFIAGLIDGDGCISSYDNKIRIITGSNHFAISLCSLLKTLGIRSYISKHGSAKSTFGNLNLYYAIGISWNKDLKDALRIKKCKKAVKFYTRTSDKILNIKITDEITTLYDFTVKDYHNYVANGFIAHNTHCAGSIGGRGIKYRGIAPSAQLIDVRVLNSKGKGTTDNIIKGMSWAAAASQGVDIISMSLGGPGTPYDVLSREADSLSKEGIIVVVAAGNEGPRNKTIGSPGVAEYVITVGAVDQANKLTNYSSRGPVADSKGRNLLKPDIVAPGGGVTRHGNCTYGDGIIAVKSAETHSGACTHRDERRVRYEAMAGTSMATPHVAGICALLLDGFKNYIPKAERSIIIKEALKKSATKLNYDQNQVGTGLVDTIAAIEWLKAKYNL